MQKILNSGNTKTAKGEKLGWKTFGIHFAPSKLSGFNVCKWASKGCAMACLNLSGMGVFSNVQESRIKKTIWFFKDKLGFLTKLVKEIQSAIKSAEKKDLLPCFRLNLTSDLPWENIRFKGKSILDWFPTVQFYDYTKSTERMSEFLRGGLPKNYHLTLSRSEESNELELVATLNSGGNVAIVFRDKLPEAWNGFEVIDGDKSDLRFLDKPGVVVGLIEKGLAKKDETGFVLDAEPQPC
jgi:hypothetical protein